MSDARPTAREATQRKASGAPVRMFQDPVVRWMAYAAFGVVILFLATIVGALLTGVGESDSPRTAAERQVVVARAALNAGEVGGAWAPYIDALLASGDLGAARGALDAARASIPSTLTVPELELSEARLELAQKRYTQASRAADTAMKGFKARQAASIAASDAAGAEAAVAESYGEALLVKAYASVGLDKWKEAVAAYDVYLALNPTAADIFIDRGNAKINLKDMAGAEKDFRAALRFVPDDKEAQAGLGKIGAAK